VRLPAVVGRPASAYFTLVGGARDNRLMQISSRQVGKIELHESMTMGNPVASAGGAMMTMTALDGGVLVPAGKTVAFEPGGKHAMLFDINPKIGPGTTMKLRFTYSSGRLIEVDAAVTAAGDALGHSH
jgi:periplasmic copper chaperone A